MEYEQEDNVEATGSYTPAFQDIVSPDVIKFQLTFESEIGIIMARLSTMKASKELMDQVMLILSSVVNRNVYLSNYDEARVNIAAEDAQQTVNDALFEYGSNLKVSDTTAILNACVNLIESSLRRPLNQGERQFLGKTTESKHVVQQKAEEKKSLTLGGLFKNNKR